MYTLHGVPRNIFRDMDIEISNIPNAEVALKEANNLLIRERNGAYLFKKVLISDGVGIELELSRKALEASSSGLL